MKPRLSMHTLVSRIVSGCTNVGTVTFSPGKLLGIYVCFLGVHLSSGVLRANTSGVFSMDTGYTICQVHIAQANAGSMIVASTYEGTLLGLGHDGTRVWKHELSGFMDIELDESKITNTQIVTWRDL